MKQGKMTGGRVVGGSQPKTVEMHHSQMLGRACNADTPEPPARELNEIPDLLQRLGSKLNLLHAYLDEAQQRFEPVMLGLNESMATLQPSASGSALGRELEVIEERLQAGIHRLELMVISCAL